MRKMSNPSPNPCQQLRLHWWHGLDVSFALRGLQIPMDTLPWTLPPRSCLSFSPRLKRLCLRRRSKRWGCTYLDGISEATLAVVYRRKNFALPGQNRMQNIDQEVP